MEAKLMVLPSDSAQPSIQFLCVNLETDQMIGEVSYSPDVSSFKGYPMTLGLTKFLDCPERDDSVVVKVLKKQGAIPFVKTNTSQAIVK